MSRTSRSRRRSGLLDPDDVPVWLSKVAQSASLANVVAGINDDDCAVVDLGNLCLVVTTDFLNSRPILVELGLGSWRELGRLLADVNMADLCGSGAQPVALLVGATMPRDATVAEFEGFMHGFIEEANRFGVPVVGGDTKLGPARAVYAVAIGVGAREELFLKNQAVPGDDLWLSGPVGDTTAAVLALQLAALDTSLADWARNAIVAPSLPVECSRRVARTCLANAGIDLSDGFGNDLTRLCRASGVGAIVDASALPISANAAKVAAALGVSTPSIAFGIGGDLQFLITAPDSARPQLVALGLTLIGSISRAPAIQLRLADGQRVSLPAAGHRDVRGVSFTDEARSLVLEADAAIRGRAAITLGMTP